MWGSLRCLPMSRAHAAWGRCSCKLSPVARSLRSVAEQRGRAATVTAALVGGGRACAPRPARTHRPRTRARYNRAANQNASSLARRFASAAGLKLLLFEELDALGAARAAALAGREALAAQVAAEPDALVEQAGPKP